MNPEGYMRMEESKLRVQLTNRGPEVYHDNSGE